VSPALPKPMSMRGKVSARFDRWRRDQAARVNLRAGFRCEAVLDGVRCRTASRDGDHVWGSRSRISEPLLSHSSQIAALCRAHHDQAGVEPNGELRQFLQRRAIEWAQQKWPHIRLTPGEPVDQIRELERLLKDGDEWQRLVEEAGL